MSIKSKVRSQLEKTDFGTRLVNDSKLGTETKAVIGLIINVAFAMYNGILGIASHSVWFVAVCIYYLILAVMRFSAVLNSKKNTLQKEQLALSMPGVMLIILSILLGRIYYLSLSMNVASKFGEITMITVATYTFYKITMAVIRAIKDKKKAYPTVIAIHSIGYCEAAVSLLNMQRSMLITFGTDMPKTEITVLNACTGMAVFLFTLGLGIFIVRKSVTVKGG